MSQVEDSRGLTEMEISCHKQPNVSWALKGQRKGKHEKSWNPEPWESLNGHPLLSAKWRHIYAYYKMSGNETAVCQKRRKQKQSTKYKLRRKKKIFKNNIQKITDT